MDSHSSRVNETPLANISTTSQLTDVGTPSTSELYGTNIKLIDDNDVEDVAVPMSLHTTT